MDATCLLLAACAQPTESLNTGLFSNESTAQIEKDLNQERDDAVVARERSRRDGKIISASPLRTKGVSFAAGATPVPQASAGSEQYRIFGVSPSIIYGAILAALPAIATGILAVSQASTAEERSKAWCESLKSVGAALGLGGLAGYLKEAILNKLLQLATILGDRKMLQMLGKGISGLKGAIAQVGIESLFYAIRTLWHLLCKQIAIQRRDHETLAVEQVKLDEIMTFETACRVLAHIIATSNVLSHIVWLLTQSDLLCRESYMSGRQ
ncbi:uncharacterized protein DFL_001438 [Arthrobotrys flagrans]|uniref:Uncharacterized protein n=1 Tax=Arthrobotrys flagrans TaxID=97331 RepID=A0A437A7M5_ARTFL|nr:hypothetical protein DFL_001438 [Arthrobotrys flagrans]